MILTLEKRTTLVPAPVPKGTKKRTADDTARNDRDLVPGLLDLVRLRVAQLHGCEWSVQEQTQRLKSKGEGIYRLRALEDWRRKPIFSLREMAALNLAEALTCNPFNTAPDEAVHVARVFFGKPAMVRLTVVILAVNDWHNLRDPLTPPYSFRLKHSET
jgi:alkylhydroperoxidase family enzyme